MTSIQPATDASNDVLGPIHLPRITIRFCTQCKWMLRAAYVRRASVFDCPFYNLDPGICLSFCCYFQIRNHHTPSSEPTYPLDIELKYGISLGLWWEPMIWQNFDIIFVIRSPYSRYNVSFLTNDTTKFAQELLSTFSTAIGEVALVPATGGVFVIEIFHGMKREKASEAEVTSQIGHGQEVPEAAKSANGGDIERVSVSKTLLWDRKTEGGFPGM